MGGVNGMVLCVSVLCVIACFLREKALAMNLCD